MVPIDFCWFLLVSNGCLLMSIDFKEPLLIPNFFKRFRDSYRFLEIHMNSYVCPWNACGFVWIHMRSYRFLLIPIEFDWFLLVSIDSYCFLFVSFCFYRFLQIYIDFYWLPLIYNDSHWFPKDSWISKDSCGLLWTPMYFYWLWIPIDSCWFQLIHMSF